jgi:hypothetical protein
MCALAAATRILVEARLSRTDTVVEVSSVELERSTEDGVEVVGSEDARVETIEGVEILAQQEMREARRAVTLAFLEQRPWCRRRA